MNEEMHTHIEMLVEENLCRGLSPAAARRAALRSFGGVEQTKEAYRSQRGLPLLETFLLDVRYGLRMLSKSPGFTGIAVLTLALGIGSSTAIFSAINPILLEPLPFPHPGQIMMIWDKGSADSRLDVTFGTYREIAARSSSFESLAVMKPWQPTLTGRTEPERLDGQRVSARYFQVLGVIPALGRDFDSADDRIKGADVVILSYALWERRFGGDPTLIGRQIKLDGIEFTVIGVMPQSFENVVAPSAEIWSLLQYGPALPLDGREWGHHLRMMGRVRPGVGRDQATSELDVIARSHLPEYPRAPWAQLEQGLIVCPLREDITGAVRPALLAVGGAVILLLLISCVNVSNLLLSRGAQRRSEFAMRAALGAGRARLVRQMLTESLLLSILGGAFGIVVAQAGVRALVALSPPELPRISAIAVNGPVLGFALFIATATGLAVGVIPALYLSRHDLHLGIQESSRRAAGGHQWTRRALVVSEVALALVLLVGAGLLLRSLQQLFNVSPGFDPTNLLTMQVQTSGLKFEDDIATHTFFQQALEAVRRLPGVRSAAFTSQLPLSGDYEKYGVYLESPPSGDSPKDESALRCAVTPDYFSTMGIPLQRGRLLDEHDVAGAPPALVISDSLARHRFQGLDPLGRRVRVGSANEPWFTIVGVAGDVKQASLAQTSEDAVYTTPEQWSFADRTRSLVVRTQGDPVAMTNAIRNAIWSVDKDQPVVRVATMENLLAKSEARRRFALFIFEAFALAALALAAAGIYGVLSGSVSERTREIGIRSALGASRFSILTLVLREGMALTAFGALLGLGGAMAASRSLISLLYGISRLDEFTYAAVVSLLMGVAAIACWIPSWRAAHVDPMVALRCE